jgi:hypothetical protein
MKNPYDETFSWFPWHRVTEVDRTPPSLPDDYFYEGNCWIGTWGVRQTRTVISLLTLTVGPQGPTQCWMHVCEKQGEKNLCLRPEHIRLVNRGDNVRHRFALERQAGVRRPMSEKNRRAFGDRVRGTSPSAETRAKISAANKGQVIGPEQRAQISATLTGRKRSPESIAKTTAKIRGQKRTPEQRARMSAARMGYRPSPEAVAKMAASLRGRKQPLEEVERRAAKLRGLKRSPESLERLSAAAKRRGTSHLFIIVTCEHCGKDFTRSWLRRHIREGRCVRD